MVATTMIPKRKLDHDASVAMLTPWHAVDFYRYDASLLAVCLCDPRALVGDGARDRRASATMRVDPFQARPPLMSLSEHVTVSNRLTYRAIPPLFVHAPAG